MEKIYFNLTKIMNGWTLRFSPLVIHNEVEIYCEPQERSFSTLIEAFDFIENSMYLIKERDRFVFEHVLKEDDEKYDTGIIKVGELPREKK